MSSGPHGTILYYQTCGQEDCPHMTPTPTMMPDDNTRQAIHGY